MALNYLDKAAWDAGVYKDKGNDDDTQQDTSSEDSGYSASGILSAAKNFLEHPFQGMGTVIAPNYTPRPLDDSVYSDIPGTPVASGQFGELEDESVRDERMKDSADYMAANWPRLYGGFVAADEGLANVVGGIQNAVGGGNGILTNVQRAEEGMQDYRDQWNNTYGDSYFLNPNKFATDAGSVIGSSVPIMAFSGLMPGAAVAGGTRALTSALSRAGLGRLAMSKAGQALIADTVRSIPTSNLADSLSEYGTVVNDMMQNGVSEDEARRRAIPMFFKNMALDTFTVPLELGVMKGGKGIATGLLGRGAEEGIGKSLAKGAARTGMLAGASGLTEGYQEGAQNALENDVEGNRDGGWYNPFTWTKEDWEAARGGFVGGALMGVPGNVAAGFHPETRQAPLSAESQEQVQSIKNTLSHGKPKGMSNAAYNAYIELANSGNPDLIKQAASSLESFQKSQVNSSSESTDDAATEAYQDYETYDQKETIADFLDNNTVEQIGGEDNYNWLVGVLRNGTPEEVQKAYNDVIAAEKATAEQEAKNRPARSGGSVSPNTGNAMVNAVIQAANDSGVDPRLALAIAARESGGDDVNAIHMPDPHDGIYGIMQAQDETVADLGLDSQYPDWKTDPYQNAMVGMAILKSKIANEDGDVWAGVRDYNGAGEEAEQYRQLVKNNYDNMGDIGNSGNVEAPSEAFYDLSDAMNPQVDGMDPNTMAKMNLLARDFYQKYGHRLLVTSLKRNGDGSSYHDEGHAFDFSDDFLEQNPDARDWLVQQGEKYGLKGLDEFSHPVATTDGGNVHFTDHGGPVPGGASGAVSGKITSDDGQFDRELDQAAQEAKNDMDRIQAQSDQAMNEIMNDDSAEKTAQEAQEDAENAQKQAEESQQSTQDTVVPDVAQTIRDTSNNIDEINALDGMFIKDGNGNDKFIDTPENRDFIKANYKDEIDAAVKKAMQKTTAPKIKTQKKEDLPIVDGTSDVGPAARFMKSPHARLGNILADYDRNDPKFKGYMETFRHGTDEQQAQLADQLQQAQEQAKANSTTSNATVTTPSPANPSQQAVQAPKPAARVNTPTPTQTAPKKAPKAQYEWGMRGYHWSGELNDKGKINIREADMSMYDSDMQFDVAKIQKAIAKAKTEEEARGIIRNIAKNTYGAHVERLRMKIGGNASVEEWRTKHKESPEIQEVYDDLTKGLTNLYEQATGKTLKEQFAEKAPTKAVEAPKEKPTTNNTETPKETPQKEKVEEKKGEVKHEENKGNHVNAEPQQTESKDKESTHAEEGSQGDVQAQQDVNDAALSIGGKIFQLIERRKPRRYDKKAILHYLKSVYITPYEENGAYYIDIDNFEIEKTIKVSKKDYDYAVKYTKDGKWVGSYYQQQDNKEIKKAAPNDADIRFGTVDDAEKAVMEAFGVKPHKKPADTPAVPRKASTKATPKKAVKKAVIKDNDKIEKTFHLLDDSDEALEAEKKAILEELSHLSANPAFNPTLMYHLLKFGAIHVQRGLNEFARWAKAMKDTLPQSEPFLQSVWASLQSMPNHAKLDEKQLTAAIRYIGSLYDHGMTDKVDLRKSFIATLGVKNAKYFDAVYNAVMEYPSIEELKGANDNVNSNVPELVARSGEGASENAVGESRIQGGTAMRGSRQDTAPAGKGPEEPGMGHDSVPGSSTATGRTTGNRRVQTQESKDSTGSTGSTELPGSVRAGLERVPDDDQRRPDELVRAAQNRPQHEDPVETAQKEQKDKHLDEIKKALPMLLPQQAEDVCIAEDRFKEHSGMMFTNGTGTGKTYTGLGIVKRFVDANKKNILIIAPSDGILKQWEEAATKDFGITLTRLNSTKDAGKDAVTATYANVGANRALVNRDFDLVITDESHNLMGSESAKPTDALQLVRAVTGHEDGFQRYHHDKHPEISSKLDELHEEIKKLRKRDSQNGKAYNETHDPSLADESREIRNQIEKLEEERSKWHKKLETFKDADEKAFAEKQPSKVLFLSATPFQYVADLDYANGYLFNYSDYGPMDEQGYNRANGRETFYMENFGYKMRYNRLERPSADVDTDLMEREFNRKMVESGAMHGRMLSSAYDYDRGFIRVDAGIGKKIDEGFDWLRDQPRYSELNDFLRGRFTGQQKYYLLEAIKAKQAIPLIKEYIKEGKKVVIFHNFNKGGADNPFAISREGMDHLERLDSELADHILEQYHEFQAERPDLADLDLNDLESPIETLSKAFGDELVLYNGTLSKGEREKNKNSFNNDDSKTKIILVQSAAGQAGVSLHDTTGKHQRALINLGLPTRPSEAIQQEGRIYRVGNKSNAIFRYLNTGTYMEQMAFATKLAERAGTVENIALGEMARSLKQAYVEAFEESQEGDGWKKYLPGSKTEGTGGKANDYRQEKATDFDRAKAVYFGKQKKNSRTKSQEGHDYFATPEPIGYKMVQWLQSKPGQSLLEPSAGDGAIARWMPDNTYNTVVEPSRDLTPKLMRNVAGAKVVESTFENFDLHNKFDGIAMNPPFGHGGKTAVEHVAKAYQHLKDGGRLIAIIPDGSACQKHFDKWFYGDPEAKRKEDRGVADGVLMADIHLPSVTFNREGTSVNTRMVVIDKYADEGTRQVAEAEARGRIDIAADDVSELFDRIEGMDMPERLDMSDEKKQTSIRKAGQQLSRSKEELKAEIKEAFPNAKEIKDEGDRMTFTMPNGSHIIVDMKNEIVLTDKELAQAKKDHHIDDNGNVIVEGYAQLHGKDAYMALSQGSRENTGFHEAYHLAEGAVLTDREKAAIKKAIPDAEKRADKYAKWVEARKHGRGTAWGKLFQKIKDFAAKMKKIFTGTETVNNIFRQIESGRVWERNVREQGTKQSNQPLYQAKHIVSTFADKINLNRFVNAVLTHNEKSLIMHLGKVDADEAVAIKEATGYDVSNYEHVWRSNDVRHAQKRHGIDTETASDQIGLSPEEMVDALKVISAPDKIERGSINKEGPSIRYIKADNNGQLTIVEVVRSKRKTLDIKTMWKKRAEKLHGDYALQDTSETALDATSSTTENVAHNTDNVNGEKHYSIRKPKDAADEAQEKAEQVAEDTAVTMKDILAAARKILPIYTRSKIHYNSRATYRYDEHGRAGFVPSNYTLGDIGASIALHLDHVAKLKGANVELTNDVLDELEIEQRAAKKYKQEAPKAMTPVEARREGVKEFGRIYFQDPARAKEKYPKYYDIFEKTLDGMPEEKAAVEKILELEAQRAAQNPLLLATAGLSLADDRKKPKTVKERLNTAWARFYRTMVDETDPLRQITKCIEMELGKKLADEKDPHKRAVMCNSVAEGRASMLLFADNKAANLAYLNKIYKGAIRDKVTFEDVLNTLRKVRTEDIKKAAAKDVETYFGMYLVAQRTEEIVKTHKNYVRPEGYSHENCLRIIAEAPEAIRKAAQLYWKYNRNLVNIMEAEGLISEKQAAGLRKYEKYCPMYRDMSEHRTFDDELPTITAGRGFINQSSGIKKLKGGSILAVINPIDSMVSMTTALIARCERNDVAKVMVQSAEDHPGLGRIIVKDPSLFRADASKCAFTVMIAGKKTVYRTTPELYQALQEMSTNSAAFLTNVFGKFTDALRFGATNTPSFMVRNFIRDTLSASVNARYGKFVPIVDSIRGMKALKGDADFRAKFYGQGVPMDTYIRRDIRGAKQYKDKVQKSLKRYPLGIRQLMALSRSLVHKYNDVGEALEQGTRAGAMLNALKAGASDFEAGQEARDVTVNFSRHGSFGKKVNRYVPFFNASIQGTDKVIRTFLENPKRASLATCLYIILPTIILWAINHDDDWYKELDDNTKYTNWAVHIPGTDYHWLIPKPQEVGIGFGSGVEAVLNQMLNEDPHAMKAWARQFAEVVTPGIIMTALRPVLEWRYNYSEWTGRKLVPERLSKLPPEQQYTTATSELAKLMSQFAGKYVGLSPIAIDNFFSGWFGSLGRMSANALNKPIDAIRGSSRPPEPARYWYESPFIGSFARQDGQNSVYVERFYQLAEDMKMDYKRSDSYAKNKGKKGAPIPASLKAAQTCMKTMTKINKDIRSIKDDPKMDPETKRKRIDAAYTKMRTYAKKFVTQFDK